MPRLLASASIIALSIGAARWWRRPDAGRAALRQPEAGGAVSPTPALATTTDVAAVTRNFLLYFIVPLWAAAGIADWLCHRATDIEHTTGTKESLLHLLMLVEMGVPVLAGLFLEITSPVLALMIAAFLLHEVTALWDVSYAVTGREVTPLEQHVHSFLEMLPLMALAFIAALHWPQLRGLFMGGATADHGLRRKRQPLPPRYVGTVLANMVFLEAVPYLEELVRCLAVARRRRTTLTTGA